MNPGEIAALVSSIAALAGAGAFYVGRHDKKKDPLPKEAAEVAIAKDALGVVKASHDTLVADVKRLNERIDDVEGEAHTLREEVQMLRREVQSIRSAWAMWFKDLENRWVVHRQQDAPPPPPTTD